jgi:hypothetical protein
VRVVSEPFTVFAEPGCREVHLLMAGVRVTFSEREAIDLSRELRQALAKLGGIVAHAGPPPDETDVARAGAPEQAEGPAERDAALLDRVEAIRRRAALNMTANGVNGGGGREPLTRI